MSDTKLMHQRVTQCTDSNTQENAVLRMKIHTFLALYTTLYLFPPRGVAQTNENT